MPSSGWKRLHGSAIQALAQFLSTRCWPIIHSDARWLPLLRKLGMAPEQLAAIKFDVTLPQ